MHMQARPWRAMLFVIPALLVAAGCSAAAGPNLDARSTIPNNPPNGRLGGDATIQGLVLGYTQTSGNSWTTEPVAGTQVEYATYTWSAGDSSGSMGPVLGSVTADAQGLFTIPGIANGRYALRFTPPPMSPYGGGVRNLDTEGYSGVVATFSLLRR